MRWLVEFVSGMSRGVAGNSSARAIRPTRLPRAAQRDQLSNILGRSLILCLAASFVVAAVLAGNSTTTQKSSPPPERPLWAPPAQNIDAALATDPAAAPRVWTHIILHHSASTHGSAQSFDQQHRLERGWVNGLGYHFVIGNGNGQADGQVVAGPRWFEQRAGAHANSSTFNEHGIGICLVGNFDLQPPTPAQLDAAKKLITALVRRCEIARHNILGHNQVRRGGSTACPGKLLNLDELRGPE